MTKIDIFEGTDPIAAERYRQIVDKRYTAADDDRYTGGQLMRAAMCYLWWEHPEKSPPLGSNGIPVGWPWLLLYWKPKDRVRNIIRAGALMMAEIDRLRRAGFGTAHVEHKLNIARRELKAATYAANYAGAPPPGKVS